MLQPNRNFDSQEYRYGFQGQEKDSELKGEGNSLNYKYRMHDPRIGRFFAVDLMTAKYPFYSPYAFSGNRVIDAIELEGLQPGSSRLVNKVKIRKHSGDVKEKMDLISVDRHGKERTERNVTPGVQVLREGEIGGGEIMKRITYEQMDVASENGLWKFKKRELYIKVVLPDIGFVSSHTNNIAVDEDNSFGVGGKKLKPGESTSQDVHNPWSLFATVNTTPFTGTLYIDDYILNSDSEILESLKIFSTIKKALKENANARVIIYYPSDREVNKRFRGEHKYKVFDEIYKNAHRLMEQYFGRKIPSVKNSDRVRVQITNTSKKSKKTDEAVEEEK